MTIVFYSFGSSDIFYRYTFPLDLFISSPSIFIPLQKTADIFDRIIERVSISFIIKRFHCWPLPWIDQPLNHIDQWLFGAIFELFENHTSLDGCWIEFNSPFEFNLIESITLKCLKFWECSSQSLCNCCVIKRKILPKRSIGVQKYEKI